MTTNYDSVLDLLGQVDREPDPRPVTGASGEQLAGLRETLGFDPPTALVEWLRVCNGLIAAPGGLYGVDPPEDFLDIAGVLDLHPSWRGNRWIPVASDGSGNEYVLDASRQHLDHDAVFFVDAFGEPDAFTYVVASSLDRFLRFLLLDELSGDERWPFDEAYMRAEDPDLLAVDPPELLPWNT